MEGDTKKSKLFDPYTMGTLTLKNHIVMSAMVRCRCDPTDGIPTDLHAKYYGERAESAGLVISECTYISEVGHGYPGGPGLWKKDHVSGWNKVVDTVHEKKGLIFVQLFHRGRGAFPAHVKEQAVAPSPIAMRYRMGADAKEEIYPNAPKEMTIDDIKNTIEEFRVAAKLAKEAGFDGIELHGGNGYLIDSFLRDYTNQRKDDYGGSIENRCKFVLEVIDALISVYGADRVGIKLTPVGRFQDMFDSDPLATFSYFLKKLSEKNIAYVALCEGEVGMKTLHPLDGPAQIPNLAKAFRPHFKNTLITNGNLTYEEAKRRINEGEADLACFGVLFIANPDLPERLKNGWPLAQADPETFFSAGSKGYNDYPKYEEPPVINS